jgi:hypothetical protein
MAHAPFNMVMVYVVGSIMLYWIGPINWPMTNAFDLAVFQTLAVLAIALGYFSANFTLSGQASTASLRPLFHVGVIFTLTLQIPLTLTYTNKYPWDVFQAVMDQRETYQDMLEQIASQQGERFYVPLFRSVVMPFFYAALTYGILHFKKLSKIDRLLLGLMILCPINLSLLRGTDKEIFDLLIVIGALCFVLVGRRSFLSGRGLNIPTQRVLSFTLLAIVILIGVFLLFTYRKYQRLGTADEFCFAENLVCADYSGALMSTLPDFVSFGISMLTFYLTNGYYGLSIALDQSWSFSYGLGHSAALQSLFERVTADSLIDVTLIGKVSAAGWDHRYYWVSLFPWIASDVGFFGSLVVIGLVGRWFHQAWIDSTRLDNDCAAMIFVLFCVLFFYLPANSQLTQTFDSYFAFIAAMLAWKILGKQRNLS